MVQAPGMLLPRDLKQGGKVRDGSLTQPLKGSGTKPVHLTLQEGVRLINTLVSLFPSPISVWAPTGLTQADAKKRRPLTDTQFSHLEHREEGVREKIWRGTWEIAAQRTVKASVTGKFDECKLLILKPTKLGYTFLNIVT